MSENSKNTEKNTKKDEDYYDLGLTENYTSLSARYDYPLISPNIKEHKAVVPSSTVEDGLAIDVGLNYNRTSDVMTELETIYFEDPILRAGVSIISSAVTDDGYRIVGGDKKNKDYIREFLDFMHMEEIFANAVACMMIYGEAFIEIIYKKRKGNKLVDINIGDTDRLQKEVVGIRVINPKNMIIIRDSLGKFIKYKLDTGGKRTIAYAQVATNIANRFGYIINSVQDIRKLTNYEGAYVLFEPDEIIHLKYGEIGDSGYGLSPLYSMRNISYQRRQLETDATRLMHWYAQPIFIFRLGDETNSQPANSKDIANFKAKLNERRGKPDSHLVTTIFVHAETLGAFDKALDPVPLIEFMREQTGLGLRVPSTLIGATSKGAFGGGVVQSQERMFQQLIRGIQKIIRYGLRSKLFPLIIYYQDMDMRKRGVREGGDKRNISSDNEMMFSIDFMKRIPDIIFNEIESALDKHKRIVEQFSAGLLTQELAQDAIGLLEEEVEEGQYFYEIETAQQWELQKKTLDLEQKYAKELTKLEAKLQPAVTSSTSSATKKPKGTPSSQPRKGKPTSSTRPARKTDPVGSGIGLAGKKTTTKTVSRKPKSEGIDIDESNDKR